MCIVVDSTLPGCCLDGWKPNIPLIEFEKIVAGQARMCVGVGSTLPGCLRAD